MKALDALGEYVQTPDLGPFKCRAAFLAMAEVIRRGDMSNPRTVKSLATIESCARSMVGICWLHLDMEWAKAVRAKRWWERKKFAQQEDEWKTALCHRLSAEAVRDLPDTKDVT